MRHLLVVLLFCSGSAFAESCPSNLGSLDSNQSQNLKDNLQTVSTELCEPHVKEFFDKLPPCEAKEFLDARLTGAWGSMLGMVTTKFMEDFAYETVRPTTFNELYHNHFNRPVFQKNTRALVRLLESRGVVMLKSEAILSAAKARYESAKSNGDIGECFDLDTQGGAKYIFGARRDSIAVSAFAMKKIESLFQEDSPVRKVELSEKEQKLISEGTLTKDQIYELRAIRSAMLVYENNSVMKDKEPGGYISNFYGELTGGFKQNCQLQGSTYQNFLNQLSEKGLLKNFKKFEEIGRKSRITDFTKDPSQGGHAATSTTIPGTGKKIVFDSWFEAGGNPAHVIFEDEWRDLSLVGKNKFNEIVEFVP